MTNIELFAGGGGLALGLEYAGFETLGCVERDKSASNTLKHNRPNWNVISDDVKNIAKKNLCEFFGIEKYELDLLSGGAPCQSFSYAGKRLGLKDTRGTMFYYYAKFLKKLQPKIFLFENVKGLLKHDGGKTFETITNVFNNLGYNIHYQVLNAYDFKTPQKRERLIIIGIRKDLELCFEFPKPFKEKYTLGDFIRDCPKSEGAKYPKEKIKYIKLVPEGGNWKHIPEKLAYEYIGKKAFKDCKLHGGNTGFLRRLSFSEPAPTILTSPAQKRTDRCHPKLNRPLTVREAARVQTFPDDWEFCGSLSSKYKQIGNAVPVNLAYFLGKSIRKSLKNKVKKVNSNKYTYQNNIFKKEKKADEFHRERIARQNVEEIEKTFVSSDIGSKKHGKIDSNKLLDKETGLQKRLF